MGHRVAVVAGLLVLIGTWPAALLAQIGGGDILSGTVRLTWVHFGDGRTDEAVPVLAAEDGRSYVLEVDDRTLDRLGAVGSLSGRRVTVRIDRSDLDAARAGSGRPLRVLDLQPQPQAGRSAFDADPLLAVEPTGARPVVTLLCRYADAAPGGDLHPPSHYAEVMSGTYPNVGHYWEEVSGGRVSLAGSVVRGWYDLPRAETEYRVEGRDLYDAYRLASDCMAAADAEVHFPDFGGVNVQTSGGVAPTLNVVGFATVLDLDLDGLNRSYPVSFMSVRAPRGTYIHELGHTLGLPHSSGPYGATYDSPWDIMSDGDWSAAGPSDMAVWTIAYHVDRLGWIEPRHRFVAPAGESRVVLAPLSAPATGTAARIVIVPLPGGEYYTLETRRRGGYEDGLPGEGVVIHHIQPTRFEPAHVVDVDGNEDPGDAGAIWLPGETFRDRAREVEVLVERAVDAGFELRVRVAALDSLIVLPSGHRRELPFGWTGVVRDSAYVRIAGGGAGIAWTASAPWGGGIELETSAGIGSGWVRWSRMVEPWAEGSYLATLLIEAPGTVSPRAEVIDTVVIGAPTSLAGAFAGGTQTSILMAGLDQPGIGMTLPELRISGPGGEDAAWRVVRKPAWMTLTPESGRGTGWLYVGRSAAGMSAGSHADTVVIEIAGAAQPARLIDRIDVIGPVTVTVERPPIRPRLVQEGPGVPDSVWVDVSGPGAARVALSVSGSGPLATTTYHRTGPGWIPFRYTPWTLEPGLYPTELTVAAALDPSAFVVVRDTVEVVAAPPSFHVSAPSVRDTAREGEWSEGEVYVTPQGAGASTRPWRALAGLSSQGRLLVLYGTGENVLDGRYSPKPGARAVRWVRSVAERPAGWGVDTIYIAYSEEPRATVLVLDSVWTERSGGVLTITSDSVRPAAEIGADYRDPLELEGAGSGVRWSVAAGTLPPGLALDSATGVIAGIPEAAGQHRFRVMATYGPSTAAADLRVDVGHPVLADDAVLRHLLSGSGLALAHARYLDLVGNRNGRVDVGDVYVWLQANAHIPAAELRALMQTMAAPEPSAPPPRKEPGS